MLPDGGTTRAVTSLSLAGGDSLHPGHRPGCGPRVHRGLETPKPAHAQVAAAGLVVMRQVDRHRAGRQASMTEPDAAGARQTDPRRVGLPSGNSRDAVAAGRAQSRIGRCRSGGTDCGRPAGSGATRWWRRSRLAHCCPAVAGPLTWLRDRPEAPERRTGCHPGSLAGGPGAARAVRPALLSKATLGVSMLRHISGQDHGGSVPPASDRVVSIR
jgi:hypothetical protein